MAKLALIVQRYADIPGGSEAEARAYANLLGADYDVEVLTTTARDVRTWANELPPGESREGSILVRRFPVSIGRSRYWEALYDIQLRANAADIRTSLAFQEEWIRRQGPHSEGLLAFLKERGSDYTALLYFTYLYSPTYFGMQQTPASANILVPTLHNEPAAQMQCFRAFSHRARAIIFNSEAERQLARHLWDCDGPVAGFPVPCPDGPLQPPGDYVLYAGRIEPGKGCDELLDYFEKYAVLYPGLRLVLIGKNEMKLPSRPWLDYQGFVSEQKKAEWMASALCLVMPSRNESFSIVTLESMAAGVPVVATAASPVLADHVSASGCGRTYTSVEEFADAIAAYRDKPAVRRDEGEKGQKYVRERYSPAAIRELLLKTISGR